MTTMVDVTRSVSENRGRTGDYTIARQAQSPTPFTSLTWNGTLALSNQPDSVGHAAVSLFLRITAVGGSPLLSLPFPSVIAEKLRINLESIQLYIAEVVKTQSRKVTMVMLDVTGARSQDPQHYYANEQVLMQQSYSALIQSCRDKNRGLAFDHQKETEATARFLLYVIPPSCAAFPAGWLRSLLGCDPPANKIWGLLLTSLDYNHLIRQQREQVEQEQHQQLLLKQQQTNSSFPPSQGMRPTDPRIRAGVGNTAATATTPSKANPSLNTDSLHAFSTLLHNYMQGGQQHPQTQTSTNAAYGAASNHKETAAGASYPSYTYNNANTQQSPLNSPPPLEAVYTHSVSTAAAPVPTNAQPQQHQPYYFQQQAQQSPQQQQQYSNPSPYTPLYTTSTPTYAVSDNWQNANPSMQAAAAAYPTSSSNPTNYSSSSSALQTNNHPFTSSYHPAHSSLSHSTALPVSIPPSTGTASAASSLFPEEYELMRKRKELEELDKEIQRRKLQAELDRVERERMAKQKQLQEQVEAEKERRREEERIREKELERERMRILEMEQQRYRDKEKDRAAALERERERERDRERDREKAKEREWMEVRQKEKEKEKEREKERERERERDKEREREKELERRRITAEIENQMQQRERAAQQERRGSHSSSDHRSSSSSSSHSSRAGTGLPPQVQELLHRGVSPLHIAQLSAGASISQISQSTPVSSRHQPRERRMGSWKTTVVPVSNSTSLSPSEHSSMRRPSPDEDARRHSGTSPTTSADPLFFEDRTGNSPRISDSPDKERGRRPRESTDSSSQLDDEHQHTKRNRSDDHLSSDSMPPPSFTSPRSMKVRTSELTPLERAHHPCYFYFVLHGCTQGTRCQFSHDMVDKLRHDGEAETLKQQMLSTRSRHTSLDSTHSPEGREEELETQPGLEGEQRDQEMHADDRQKGATNQNHNDNNANSAESKVQVWELEDGEISSDSLGSVETGDKVDANPDGDSGEDQLTLNQQSVIETPKDDDGVKQNEDATTTTNPSDNSTTSDNTPTGSEETTIAVPSLSTAQELPVALPSVDVSVSVADVDDVPALEAVTDNGYNHGPDEKSNNSADERQNAVAEKQLVESTAHADPNVLAPEKDQATAKESASEQVSAESLLSSPVSTY